MIKDFKKFNEKKENIYLSDNDYELLYKKLEYRFKKSENALVTKIKDKKELSEDDIELLLKKLEYSFRKSEPEIIERLKKMIDTEVISNVKYSNLKAKKQRDIKEKE
jgi:hypothetical protein